MRAPRSLVLVTIDCFRADHAGFLGYSRPTTPFLDCLAAESTVFKNAVATGSPTYYSLPGLLASRPPLALGRDLLGIAPEENTIASVLRESGFRTAAFSAGNPYISARFGYEQGFEVFRDFSGTEVPRLDPGSSDDRMRTRANQWLSWACHTFRPLGMAYDEIYFEYCQRLRRGKEKSLDSLRRFPAADIIVDHAIAWLRENTRAPFFLWLHLMDPHSPYFPKPQALGQMGEKVSSREARYLNSYWARGDVTPRQLGKKKDAIVRLYDAGIRWADEQLRRLCEQLIELTIWDKCMLAVTADHGEEFLEHDGRFHPPEKLAEELIHVPLLTRVPGQSRLEIERPCSLLDLAPTLLDFLEIPAPADFRGRSLRPLVEGRAAPDRPVITECVRGCTNPFHPENRAGARILAVRQGDFKLVIDFAAGAEQLFDLRSDPSERNPLPVDTEKPVRKRLLECAKRHVAESHQSRDFDRRHASRLRDLRLEWAHPAAS
ncbi:MAG TPA: sulfatase [Terriglobales bacterium]|nr:sulfatase [Terriglobales bacterium]